jgi:vacuolar protein sorting-associated protein 72
VEKQTPEKEANATEPSEKNEKAPESAKQSEKRHFAVEIPASDRLSGSQNNGSAQTMGEPTSAKNDDAMDVDQPPALADVPKDNQAQDPVKANLTPSDTAGAQPVSAQEPKADAPGPTPEGQPPAGASQPVKPATHVGSGVALAPHISATAAVSSATVPENAFLQTQNQQTWHSGIQPPNGMGPVQPAIQPSPPVIEHTGRTLTILENFDHATAHSRKYSMYFNSKKQPRLTSTLHHILHIT